MPCADVKLAAITFLFAKTNRGKQPYKDKNREVSKIRLKNTAKIL